MKTSERAVAIDIWYEPKCGRLAISFDEYTFDSGCAGIDPVSFTLYDNAGDVISGSLTFSDDGLHGPELVDGTFTIDSVGKAQ